MGSALMLKQTRQEPGKRPPGPDSKPALLMSEGIMKREYLRFSNADRELIENGRKALAARGMTDGTISRVLAGEMGRKKSSISGYLRRSMKAGKLGENPNRRNWNAFSDAEKKRIARIMVNLVAAAKKNREIARALGRAMGRTMDSVLACIRRMVKAGKLGKNPNRGSRRYSAWEDKHIRKTRVALARNGKTDMEIANVLAKEMRRSAGGIAARITCMIRTGNLKKNRNSELRKLSVAEKELILRRRVELVREGKNDHQIANVLTGETRKKEGCILAYISHMVREGKLGENPHKREMRRFSVAERRLMEKRREELLMEGNTDNRIANVIGREMSRKWRCVLQYIKDKVEKGMLDDNPNKRSLPHRVLHRFKNNSPHNIIINNQKEV